MSCQISVNNIRIRQLELFLSILVPFPEILNNYVLIESLLKEVGLAHRMKVPLIILRYWKQVNQNNIYTTSCKTSNKKSDEIHWHLSDLESWVFFPAENILLLNVSRNLTYVKALMYIYMLCIHKYVAIDMIYIYNYIYMYMLYHNICIRTDSSALNAINSYGW